MRYKTFDVIAPLATGESFSEVACLGGATWLWMHSKNHQRVLHFFLRTCRADESGRRVMHLKGKAVMADEAAQWFATHPFMSAAAS